MKKKKMIALFVTMECIYISLLLTGCVLLLRSCNPKRIFELELVTSGDFIYTESGKKASIMGISEEGKKKDTLVFQTKLDEYRVTSIGTQIFYHRYSDNLDIINPNVYFCNAYVYYDVYMNYDGTKNIYIPSDYNNCFPREKTYYANVFLSYNLYKFFLKYDTDWYDIDKVYCANVMYYSSEYDYQSDHCFFVDDVDGKTISVIPPDPCREGYKFMGWYKEKERINKWDFENDVVPKKKYDENGKYIYMEDGQYTGTILYAKWEEI